MADAHPKAGASHKRVGSLVRGKYRVEAFLATGTMANVYAATHRNGAKVALKILHAQLAEDPSLCERFKREGYFANSIGHPGIVRAIDDDVTEDGCPFMVMELLEGETLDERRRRKGGKLPLSWVLPVADSLLDILAAAHAREVLHRDLKPDNVFVTKDGDVKILDFGVARWNDGKSSSDMTAMGMVLGTPAYMPPEQALGRREDVDAQSDLWAVGATLFVVLSGEPVHVGGDAKAKLIATARTAARPLQEAAPEVPRAVAAVIDRALAFHKQERWLDAVAMREALRWARMSVEGHPNDPLEQSNEHGFEPIPPPVPTQRTFEDVTIARALIPDEPVPQSFDVVTSAPPITMRDVPRSPNLVDVTLPGSPPAEPMRRDPAYAPLREDDDTTQDKPPSTARFFPPPPVPPLPEQPPVATGAKGATLSMPSTRSSSGVVIPPPAAVPAAAGSAPAMSPRSTLPIALPPGSAVSGAPGPMGAHPSAPPPYAHYSSAPPAFPQAQTQPPRQRSQAPAPVRPSLTPEAPGPMLAQVVKPRTGPIRGAMVLALGLLVGVVAFVVARSRAASTRAETAPAASSSMQIASNAAPASAALPASAPGSVAALPSAVPSAHAPALVASAATPATVKKPRPRPHPHKPATPRPPAIAPPVAATETSAAATAAAPDPASEPLPTFPVPPTPAEPPATTPPPTPAPTPSATTPPPVDTTPRDSLPSREPDPSLTP